MSKKRKKINRNPLQRAKKETNDWCSRYVRIKAAVEFGDTFYPYLARCYTCGKIVDVVHKANAGHFKSRGIGGSSGLYFNVKVIRLQCIGCNAFEQGRPQEFRAALVEEYDEAVVQELERIHLVKTYSYMEIVGLGLYFKEEVEKMCRAHRIRPWW